MTSLSRSYGRWTGPLWSVNLRSPPLPRVLPLLTSGPWLLWRLQYLQVILAAPSAWRRRSPELARVTFDLSMCTGKTWHGGPLRNKVRETHAREMIV